jgi:hypothetical protein
MKARSQAPKSARAVSLPFHPAEILALTSDASYLVAFGGGLNRIHPLFLFLPTTDLAAFGLNWTRSRRHVQASQSGVEIPNRFQIRSTLPYLQTLPEPIAAG